MDVDKAIRILNKMVTDSFGNLDENEKIKIIYDFLKIRDDNKPISFRKKNNEQIKYFAFNINKQLKNIIEQELKQTVKKIIESSDNNKIDSDVLIFFDENEKTINGELKFGNITDANIGINTFSKIFTFKNKTLSWKNFINKY